MSGRILRVITRLNVGGPATHVVLADRGLKDRGWTTLLVYGSIEPDESEVAIPTDIATRRVADLARPIRPLPDARAAATIARIIRGFRPDVIHTHLSKAGLLGRTAALVTTRAPLVHTFHGNVFAGYFGGLANAGILRAERLLAARTAAILALSERQREELIAARVGDPRRIEIVPLGLDLKRFGPPLAPDRDEARRSLGIPDQAIVFAAVGRLVAIKRLEILLAAFAIARADLATARLYLVGGGDQLGRLERLAHELGIADSTTFVGWSSETPRWYAASDVVCLTSDREGTPLALIEAAASGRPVIATDVGGVADIVIDGVTGIVVPPGDVQAFSSAMIRLGRDSRLREALGAATPPRAAAFAAERLVGDLDSLYRRLLVGRRR